MSGQTKKLPFLKSQKKKLPLSNNSMTDSTIAISGDRNSALENLEETKQKKSLS